MSKKLLAVVCFFAFVSCARPNVVQSVSVTASSATEVELQPFEANVWLHTSYRVLPGVGRFPSHGLLVQHEEQLLLVDTAWGEEATRRLFTLVRAQFGRLPTAAIVTHAHDDRVGGLAVLRAAGIPVYGSAATAALVLRDDAGVIDHTFATSIEQQLLAGEQVELFAPGAAHTPDNIVVWFPSRGLLFGGCMIRPAAGRSLGNLADADVSTWAASSLRVAERYARATRVIPSHGAPGDASLLTHTVALAHAALPERVALRRAEQLPVLDGTSVQLCGRFEREQSAENPVSVATLRLDGNALVRVFLRSPLNRDALLDRVVCVHGNFTRAATTNTPRSTDRPSSLEWRLLDAAVVGG